MEMLKYAIVDPYPISYSRSYMLNNIVSEFSQCLLTRSSHQVIGLHYHADGQHYHFVWGPDRYSNASEDDDVRRAYYTRQ
jgi:hypothetical protein